MNLRLTAASLIAAFGLAAAGPAAAADAPAAVIHIKNFMFVPETLTVAPGTKVTFVNDDEEPHTVTATDKSFDSEGLDLHGKWTHAFTKPGTVTYFCELHPYMKGRLTVRSGVKTQ